MTETRGRPVVDYSQSGQTRREGYAWLRGAGLCAWSATCGQPAESGSPHCTEHREKMRSACASIYAYRKANDLCRNCGVEVIGKSRCWLCTKKRESYASRQADYRKTKERAG